MPTIEPLDLSSTINDLLDEYGDDVRDILIDVETDVAKQAAQKLKAETHGATDWKKYPRTWTSQVETTRTGAEAHVYNSKSFQLAHLLEFGHALAGGGRSSTRAFPHIAPINDWTQEEFEKRVEEEIEKA